MTNVLEAVLQDVDQQLTDGFTLPATWYWHEAVFVREREQIFSRMWQYAGPSDWISEPGQYFPCKAGQTPLVVTRGDDGEVRAFVNICRHRGCAVVRGRGDKGSLQCPYHAWTYGMDGSLRAAPRSEREPSFDRAEFGLAPARAEVWGPFVFVNADPNAAPLSETLRDLPAAIAASGLDVSKVRFHERAQWDPQPINWKVGVENDLECYHCSIAHPGFTRFLDTRPDAWGMETQSTYTSQTGLMREKVIDGTVDSPYDINGEVKRSQAHVLWPNVAFHVLPGQHNMTVMSWRPTGPQQTIVTQDFYFSPDASEEFIADYRRFDAEVGGEDEVLIAAVQEGLSSGVFPHGRLLLDSENLIASFQRWLYEALQ
jgi:phenylpropionate dioxygenase-like ring-hydroxylating dioxygenase large terminal subunit